MDPNDQPGPGGTGDGSSGPGAPADGSPPGADAPGGAAASGKSSTGLDDNVAGALCYLLGFLTGILFLVIEKDSEFVRFHAMQSTITFVGLFVLSFALGLVPLVNILAAFALPIVSLVVWVLAMLRAFRGERYKLPIAGDLTEQQLSRA